MEFEKLNFIIQKFFLNSKVLSISMINSGLINKTYIVEHLYDGETSKFILQSLGDIFESHDIVNMNHKLITDNITEKIKKSNLNVDLKSWQVPSLIRCRANNLFSFPFDSGSWRVMKYIDKSFSIDFLEDEIMAFQVGLGLAKFHLICSDIDCSRLQESIKNFHNISYYIDQYFITLNDYDFMNLEEEVYNRIQKLIYCLSNHLRYVEVLLKSLKQIPIDHKVIHGDPKLSNFLFDINSKHVISLIDLDTVSSGYFLTDLADCIRSICNLAGEEPKNKENVHFNLNSCKHFLKGYFSISNYQINHSFMFLPEYIYLIIIELCIRFLTDFMQSSKYFRIKYKTHNLYRAEIQYRLLLSFLIQIPNLSLELEEIGISIESAFVSDVQKFV